MPVDPQLLPLLEALKGLPHLQEMPLELLRQGPGLPVSSPVALARVVNRNIPTADGDLPVRIYYPREASVLPVLVYYHGGGWVLGNLDSHDAVVRELAATAGCVVVSVDYRLAPEYRYPAAVQDCLAATRWVYAHAAQIGVDPMRIAVGGDSAGGNLAAVVSLKLRDTGGPALKAQLLVYPATQLRAPREGSLVTNADGYFLRTVDMDWFENHYLGDSADPNDPAVSPLLARDLSRLPRALVITAEFDPLRDQGEAYARRLREAGVVCAYSCYAGAIHGFFGMPAAIGHRAVAEAGNWLKSVLV